jgi:hypothetical protein
VSPSTANLWVLFIVENPAKCLQVLVNKSNMWKVIIAPQRKKSSVNHPLKKKAKDPLLIYNML